MIAIHGLMVLAFEVPLERWLLQIQLKTTMDEQLLQELCRLLVIVMLHLVHFQVGNWIEIHGLLLGRLLEKQLVVLAYHLLRE